jgi:CRP-like cAMP-binding protein
MQSAVVFNTAFQPLAGVRPGYLAREGNPFAALEQLGTVVTLRRHGQLFFCGDPADSYYKVLSGAVRGCRLMADGRRHITDFFLPGDFIGLDAEGGYSFVAEAVTGTTVVRYPRAKVDALTASNPQIAKCLVDIMRADLAAARERIALLGHRTAMERIASFLLHVAERCGDDQIRLPMTRSDIGDYLGLTIETVSRALSQLKYDGIIRQKNLHEMSIADRPGLELLREACLP